MKNPTIEDLAFVRHLFKDVDDCLLKYFCEKQIWKDKGQPWAATFFMDKDKGKYAIKRKITMLRQELLNLEKQL